MKSGFLIRAGWGLALLLGWPLALAWGQATQCPTPNPPARLFTVRDASNNVVEALCQGSTIRIVPDPSRPLQDPAKYYYIVRPGTQVDCNPVVPSTTFTYTVTAADVAAGQVTISELADASGPPLFLGSTLFFRRLPVYGNAAPTFTLAPCPNGQALVTLTAPTPYDTYDLQADSGPVVRLTPGAGQVVPAPAGSTISVTGHYTLNTRCTGTGRQTLPALAPAGPPRLPRLTLQGPLPGGAGQLDLADLTAGYLFELQSATGPGGSFQKVADLTAGSTSYSFPAIPAGCYRVQRTDVCNAAPPAYGNVVCTLSLAVTSAQNRNNLLLTDAGAGGPYTVTRTPALPAGADYLPVPGGLRDTAVLCGTTYTYRVTAARPGGGESVSNAVTVNTVSDLPPATPLLIASFSAQNTVDIFARQRSGTGLPLNGTVRYRRTVGGGGLGGFGSTAGRNVRRDSTKLADLRMAPPCYTARLIDECGNGSGESNPTCPVLLQATPLDDDANTIRLSWSAFAGPAPTAPVTYQVQLLAADGTVLNPAVATTASLTATDLLPPTDRQILRYRVLVRGGGIPADTASYSNRAEVVRQVRVRIPNAFTPNGDGLNDVLEVKGRFLTGYSFVIVDRNGQEVFRGRERADTWDGRINGQAPVNGAYVWRFRQTDETGEIITQTGSVTILK